MGEATTFAPESSDCLLVHAGMSESELGNPSERRGRDKGNDLKKRLREAEKAAGSLCEAVRGAARHRNRGQVQKALARYFHEGIDKELEGLEKEVNAWLCERKTSRSFLYEGRSLHLLSAAAGDWVRTPRSKSKPRKEKPATLGQRIFAQNIYAQIYSFYFPQIPKGFLISLDSIEPPPNATRKIALFDGPSWMLLGKTSAGLQSLRAC